MKGCGADEKAIVSRRRIVKERGSYRPPSFKNLKLLTESIDLLTFLYKRESNIQREKAVAEAVFLKEGVELWGVVAWFSNSS